MDVTIGGVRRKWGPCLDNLLQFVLVREGSIDRNPTLACGIILLYGATCVKRILVAQVGAMFVLGCFLDFGSVFSWELTGIKSNPVGRASERQALVRFIRTSSASKVPGTFSSEVGQEASG